MAFMPKGAGAPVEAVPESDAAEMAPGSYDASAASIVERISSDLTQLVQMMDKTKQFSPEDKAPAQQLLRQFQDYAENVLLASPNAKPMAKEPPTAPGATPMESAGNPNARPF
jgi:hypothetical protein